VNENRRGLKKLFRLARKHKLRAIVVEYKDRLARFGYSYLEELFKDHGVDIRIVNEDETSLEEELVQDLISIVTSFSARIYGKRGAKNIIQVIKKESQQPR
jgi:predicted site-specific integrase-resolvase